jgi:hypothetical protein
VQKPYDIPWFLCAMEGRDMKQINTYALYQLANQLAPLRAVPPDPAQLNRDVGFSLYLANFYIKQFFVEQRLVPLELSSDAAAELSDAIGPIATKLWAEPPGEVGEWDLRNIQTKLANLETVMGLELQRHQTYLVSQIGGYSMPLLATKAEVNILEDALAIIGEQAKKDFREAGRCLAFEVPTAAGFHAMRATEHVLRQYYTRLTGQPAGRKEWATCVAELTKAGAPAKVMQILDQVRDLHRNPLMHPQDFLSMKEAIGLFDIAKSAIGALAEEVATIEAAAEAAKRAAAEKEHAEAAEAAEQSAILDALSTPFSAALALGGKEENLKAEEKSDQTS